MTAAHELGHLVTARDKTEVLHRGGRTGSREEAYADAFARAFLMPRDTVLQRLHDCTVNSPLLSPRCVVVLADRFGVTREALVRRLEELSLVKGGTWEWFQSTGGITEELARKALGEPAPDRRQVEAELPCTMRLITLGAEAIERERMGEGQVAELLGLHRIGLCRLIDGHEVAGMERDSAPIMLE